MKINVILFYQLKEKAGSGNLEMELPAGSTIRDLRNAMEDKFPALKTQLNNVMVLMDKKIVVDEDKLKDHAEVSFLTPVGGG